MDLSHIPVSIEGMKYLTPQQREWMLTYSKTYAVLTIGGINEEIQVLHEKVEQQLINEGIYPGYDTEDECYTYIFG